MSGYNGGVSGRSPFGFDWLVEHVVASHERLSFRRGHVAGQHTHRRGLAGTVGSQEPKNLATLGLEAHVIDGRERAVTFGEMLDFNHC
jgi:hypothetical protein